MLSVHQLTCFLATYEQGSLTRAAEELGYAQPSVSEQIRALEKSLGVQLFHRVGRGVEPTTVAETMRPYAEQVLAAIAETGPIATFTCWCGAEQSAPLGWADSEPRKRVLAA